MCLEGLRKTIGGQGAQRGTLDPFPLGKLQEGSRSKIPKEEKGADGKPQETLLTDGYVVFTQGEDGGRV